MKTLNTLGGVGATVALAIATISPVSAQTYLPEQRANWCKNEVVSRYNTYRANVTITGVQGPFVSYQVNSTGRTGRCVFNNRNAFVRLEEAPNQAIYRPTGEIYWNAQAGKWIAPDGGVCNTCTPATGFPVPPVTRNGFFYLPNSMKWYDPSGRVCNTCTPRNGFPIPPQSASSGKMFVGQCGNYEITVSSAPGGSYSYQARSAASGNLDLTGGTVKSTEGVKVYKFRYGNMEYWVWDGTLDSANAGRLEVYQNNRLTLALPCVKRY